MHAVRIARLAAIAVAAALSSAAFADSQNLTVTASITAACRLTALPAMNFSLDPTSSNPGTATSAVQYKCTTGTASGNFAVNSVTTGPTGTSGTLTLSGGTATLPYTITWANPTGITGNGFGAGSTGTTVTLNGSIAATAYQNALPGTYNGSIPVSINP